MRHRIRIILEYLLGFLVIILLVLAIAGVVVVKFYGDDLQDYVMEQVNNRLDTKIVVGDASVKVFHKFPSTSILLEDVTVWSSHNINLLEFKNAGADTLLTAENLSVSFNLFGMVRKKFILRRIEIRNGSLRIFTDTGGEVNYKLAKNQARGMERDKLIDVSQLKVSGFSILLDNRVKQLKASGWVDELELNGRFSKRNSQIKGTLKGSLGEIANKGILYASDRIIGAKLNMDMRDSVYTVKAGHLQIDRVTADVDGRFLMHPGSGVELDLIAAARDLEIHEVLDLLPSEMSNPLAGIRGNGFLQVYTRITGVASSTLTPFIEASFETSDANLSWDKVPFTLKNLNLSGIYSNGGGFNPVTTTLTLESVSAVIGEDHFTGRGQIHNFYDPEFSFDLKGELHPGQWIAWYERIPLAQASGSVISDVRVSGSYDRLKPRGRRFIEFDLNGGIALEDVTLKITESGIPFIDLNGSVSIDNDLWEPTFSGRFGSSDFSLEGTGLNLLSFLLHENQDLVASASFRSNYFDLQEVLDQLPKEDTGEKAMVDFPDNLDLRLDFIFSNFKKELLVAENVRGVVLYDAPFFYVDSLFMQTMEGTLRGSFGMIQDTEGSIFTSVDASLFNLDIHKLFEAFNSFGQKQLTHEHLKGSISGTSVFSAQFDPSFRILPPTILSENEITIRDGELNDFSPIMALSRFVEVEELNNIRFNTLKNNILIKDNQVIIPAMDVQSNALNLSASGTHEFSNQYDYRLRLKLSELLYSKARGATRRSEFEVAEDASDTRTLFLKIYDDGRGATVEMDREQTARKIREDLKTEKTELKTILNRELGLFRKDEEVVKAADSTGEKETLFIFEFQDDTTEQEQQDQEKRERRRWRRTKSDTLQNKPASGFVIDE